jgi:3-hydroxyacyl-[acyl-carrier-protein] dehydratase
VRFRLVDRILALDAEEAIEVVKNVSASEDVFDDHFPGHPILPGALILEAAEQALHLLVAASPGPPRRVRCQRIVRAAFRRPVRPGDQLRLRCRRLPGPGPSWTVAAAASVDGRDVASARLEIALVPADPAYTARVREMLRALRDPLPVAFETPA